jgi:superfamily II DNA or RNA helicase
MKGAGQPAVYEVTPSIPMPTLPAGPLLPLSGVYWNGFTLRVPTNAWQVTCQMLASHGNGVAGAVIVDGRVPTQIAEDEVLANPRLSPEGLRRLQTTTFQREAVRFARCKVGSNVWTAPGSGKTTIYTAWASQDTAKTLVITKGGVRRHICSQIRTLTNMEPFLCEGEDPARPVASGRGRNKVERQRLDGAMDASIVVVGWEILPAWKRFLMSTYRPKKLVCDEVHMASSHKRGKAVIQPDGTRKFFRNDNWITAALDISKRVEARLGATATPLPDGRTKNLFGLLDLIEPGHWGSYWTEFAPSYCQLIEGDFGMQDNGRSHTDVLQARLAQVVYHVPYSVSHRDLPPCRVERFTLSPEEQRKGNAPGLAEDIRKARKVRSNEQVLQGMLLATAARKHHYTCATVEEALLHDQKVVVFTGRKVDTWKLGEALTRVCSSVQEERGKPGWKGPKAPIPTWVLTGEDSEAARHEAATAYMAQQGAAVLVATYDSMGVGIDLSDTDLALINMLPYTPLMLEQMLGRFPRLGMRRPTVIRLVIAARSIDERIASILLDKLPTVVEMTGDTRGTFLAETIEGVKGNEKSILDALADELMKPPENWLT